MRFSLRRRESHDERTARSLTRGGKRANAAEMDLGHRTPEGAVQS